MKTEKRKKQIKALAIGLQDVFLPMVTVIKSSHSSLDRVISQYDRDKNQLISIDEIEALVLDYLGIELTEPEKKMIVGEMRN